MICKDISINLGLNGCDGKSGAISIPFALS